MNFLDATRRCWVWAAAGRRWTQSLRRVLSLRDRRQKRVVLPACAEAMSREDLERPAVPYRGAVRAPIRGRLGYLEIAGYLDRTPGSSVTT